MVYFVVVDSYHGEARIYKSIESWVLDYMKTFNETHYRDFDVLIEELSNKNVDPKHQKCEFSGKEELLSF